MDAGSSSSLELPQHFRQFTISEIILATRNFDESLVIGRGGFGMVYRGTITTGATNLVAAIKRLESTSNQGAAEFWSEVQILSRSRHCHLVSLIGYCNDGQEMILVYEYMPRGTLEDHLHKLKSPLSWVRRLKICLGAARGLDYLHTGTGIKHGIIHRDVKSSNILLDDNWAAKISDFGLSKLGPINQPYKPSYVNTFVKGTFGYLDPDYFATGRLTRKSDVYAFGVVLLEVLTGKRAVDRSLDEEHWGLINWAQESMKEGRLKQIVDYNIRGRILPKCLKEYGRVADQCLHSNPKQRPTMAKVVDCLESVLALQERASNTLHPAGMSIFGGILLGAEGKRLKSLELFFDTVGGEDRVLRKFDFGTINVATENFSKNNEISVDPSMYKGRLQNGGQGVLIVRHSDQKYQKYKYEVSILVQLEHENLLQLVGYSIEGTRVFLVYGSAITARLDRLIAVPLSTLLDWNKRKKILLGVARALLYLHRYDIIHGNVTPRNILLNESLDPKLSDFSHARLIPIDWIDDHFEVDAKLEILQRHISDRGYMAPEYETKGHLSTKADVFSFGMLILETISECRHSIHRDDMTLLQYVWTNWLEGTSSNIIDPTIHTNSNSITRYIHIWLLCAQANPADRPTMEEVVDMLTNSSSLTLPIPKKSLPSRTIDLPTPIKSISPRMIEDDSYFVDDRTLGYDYDSSAIEEFVSELWP